MLLTGYIAGDMYSRQQSGPGGPTTPNAPPNISSSTANSKPGSTDYSNYANYGSYSDGGYGAPPRSYGNDGTSQVGPYSSQPPNTGAKHFNDYKDWASSWQPFENFCTFKLAPFHFSLNNCTTKNIKIYSFKAIHSYITDNLKQQINRDVNINPIFIDSYSGSQKVKYLNKLNSLSCNTWKYVGLIQKMKLNYWIYASHFE